VFGVDAVAVATFDHRVKFADGSQGYADCTGAAGSVYDALGRPATRNADAFGYNARSEVTSLTREGYWPQNFAYDGWNLVEERVAYTNGTPRSATTGARTSQAHSKAQAASGDSCTSPSQHQTSNIKHQTRNCSSLATTAMPTSPAISTRMAQLSRSTPTTPSAIS